LVKDGLLGRPDKTACTLEDAPFELEIALDPAPRSVARKGV
jgi:hypothetical protein